MSKQERMWGQIELTKSERKALCQLVTARLGTESTEVYKSCANAVQKIKSHGVEYAKMRKMFLTYLDAYEEHGEEAAKLALEIVC